MAFWGQQLWNMLKMCWKYYKIQWTNRYCNIMQHPFDYIYLCKRTPLRRGCLCLGLTLFSATLGLWLSAATAPRGLAGNVEATWASLLSNTGSSNQLASKEAWTSETFNDELAMIGPWALDNNETCADALPPNMMLINCWLNDATIKSVS